MITGRAAVCPGTQHKHSSFAYRFLFEFKLEVTEAFLEGNIRDDDHLQFTDALGSDVLRGLMAVAGEGESHNTERAQGNAPAGQKVAHDDIKEGEENLPHHAEA